MGLYSQVNTKIIIFMKKLTLLFMFALLCSCSTSTSSVVIESNHLSAGPATITTNGTTYTVTPSVTGDTIIMTRTTHQQIADQYEQMHKL